MQPWLRITGLGDDSSAGTGDDKDPRVPGGKLCESKDWLRGDGGRCDHHRWELHTYVSLGPQPVKFTPP